MTASQSTRRNLHPQFTIRSLLMLMVGVALLVTVVTAFVANVRSQVTSIVLIHCYFLAWILPCTSIGFDISRSRSGGIRGALTGIALAVLFVIVLGMMYPGRFQE